MRRCLGPKVWACLGSSDAFHRTRDRIRHSIVPRDSVEYQAPVARGDRPPPTGTGVTQLVCGRSVDSEKVVPRGGRRVKERREGGAKPRLHQARKRGTLKADRAEAENGAKEEDGKDQETENTSSWDQRLSEKAALAINAAMWTIAAERERHAYCATFARESKIARDEETDTKRSRRAGRCDADPATTAASVPELRVSLAAARRFIKRSRLIDGVFVLDADVDLAFKRWEEAGRLVGRGRRCSLSTGIATSPSPDRRGAGRKGKVKASIADANPAVPPAQRLCEAVGCSDPALYGGVRPLAKARLCRKHRRNGMVDVGSPR